MSYNELLLVTKHGNTGLLNGWLLGGEAWVYLTQQVFTGFPGMCVHSQTLVVYSWTCAESLWTVTQCSG